MSWKHTALYITTLSKTLRSHPAVLKVQSPWHNLQGPPRCAPGLPSWFRLPPLLESCHNSAARSASRTKGLILPAMRSSLGRQPSAAILFPNCLSWRESSHTKQCHPRSQNCIYSMNGPLGVIKAWLCYPSLEQPKGRLSFRAPGGSGCGLCGDGVTADCFLCFIPSLPYSVVKNNKPSIYWSVSESASQGAQPAKNRQFAFLALNILNIVEFLECLSCSQLPPGLCFPN